MLRTEVYTLATVITAIALWIIAGFAVRKIFINQNESGNAAFIPIYRGVVLYSLVWGNGYLYFLSLLPVSGLIIRFFTYYKLTKIYRKSFWFSVGLFLYPFIFFHLLIKGSNQVEIIPEKVDKKVFWGSLVPGATYFLLIITSSIVLAINSEQHSTQRLVAHQQALAASIANGEWGIIPITGGIEQRVTIAPYTQGEVDDLLESLFLLDEELNLRKIAQLMDVEQVYFGGLEWATLVALMGDERVSYEDIILIAETAHRQNNSRQMQLVITGLGQELTRMLMEHSAYHVRNPHEQPRIVVGERRNTLCHRAQLLTFLGVLNHVRASDFNLDNFVDGGPALGGITYQGVLYRRRDLRHGGTTGLSRYPHFRLEKVGVVEAGQVTIMGFGAEVLGISRFNRWHETLQRTNENIIMWLSPRGTLTEWEHRMIILDACMFQNLLRVEGMAISTPSGLRLLGVTTETHLSIVILAGMEQDLGVTTEEVFNIMFEDMNNMIHAKDSILYDYFWLRSGFRNYERRLTELANDNIDDLYERFGEKYPDSFYINDQGETRIRTVDRSLSIIVCFEILEVIIEMYREQVE